MQIFAAPCTALPGHVFCLWCDGFIFMLVQKQQLHWFKWQNSQLRLKWQNFVLWQNFRKKILWKGKCVLSLRGYVPCDHTQDGLFCWWNELGQTCRSLYLSHSLFFKLIFANCTVFFKADQEYALEIMGVPGEGGILKYSCCKTKMNEQWFIMGIF